MSVVQRRQHLREYLLNCLADNVFGFADLIEFPRLLSKLARTMESDIRVVAFELGRSGVANVRRILGEFVIGKR